MKKSLRPCSKLGCNILTRNGRCPEHRLKQRRIKSAEYHHFYSSSLWRNELRPTQLLIAPFCAECEKLGIRTVATVADHIIPHRGQWSVFSDNKNLQSLCVRCHAKKTISEQSNSC